MTVDGGQLIEQIKDAFRGVDPPAASALMNNHCEECIETSWAFSQKRWEDLAADVGSYQETALLTPDAWRYYLPTIMIWCLRDTEIVDALVDNTNNGLYSTQRMKPTHIGAGWRTPDNRALQRTALARRR